MMKKIYVNAFEMKKDLEDFYVKKHHAFFFGKEE
jgi:hypothetical protein